MNITVSAKHSNLKHWKSELSVLFIPKDNDQATWLNELTELFDPLMSKTILGKDFSCEEGTTFFLHGNNRTNSKRIVLVGLGDESNVDMETLRRSASRGVKYARRMNLGKISYFFPTFLAKSKEWDEAKMAQAIAEGALLSNYRFDKYRSDKKSKKYTGLEDITLIFGISPSDAVHKSIHRAVVVSRAVSFARDLGNTPGNELPPRVLAEMAASMCRKHKIKCSVFNEAKLKTLKMNGILSVSAGSAEPPRLIVMEYKPTKAKNSKPIVLVGKGLTFDAGGISIKPAADMDRMKFDMCGGAAVIGAMQAAADLKLPVHLVGLVPSSENLLGSRAFKPGDILTMYSGKTVEILNTDAEGRLILADALAYAQRYTPSCIIDLATLTGHIVVALGYSAAGMIGTDDEMKRRLSEAADFTHERVWEMPLYTDHEKLIKSHVADIKNIGGRPGGALTAAAFLKQFVGSTPWVHLDIAGVANTEEETAYTEKLSATGFGVRLLVEALASI